MVNAILFLWKLQIKTLSKSIFISELWYHILLSPKLQSCHSVLESNILDPPLKELNMNQVMWWYTFRRKFPIPAAVLWQLQIRYPSVSPWIQSGTSLAWSLPMPNLHLLHRCKIRKDTSSKKVDDTHRSAISTVGARHTGQFSLPRFCILTRHLGIT